MKVLPMENLPAKSNKELLPIEFSWSWDSLMPGMHNKPPHDEFVINLLSKRYKDCRAIAAGGHFDHFLAKDIVHKRLVWIKLLRPDVASNVKRRAQFRHAAAQGITAIHPLIVRTHEVVDAASTFYIVQEYLHGCFTLHDSLVQTLKTGSEFPIEGLFKMFEQVSEGLEVLHRNGLSMDLTPRHIVVTKNRTFKLISVGTSAISGSIVPDEEYASLIPPSHTRTFVAGDERCSQFTLAGIAYHLLIGNKPVPDLRPPHLKASTIPVGLSNTIAKALCSNPELRYATISKFCAAARRKQLPAYVTWTIAILFTAVIAATAILLFPYVQRLLASS